ncbi:MAG: T9SS type A sorting domain-containing protein [bacterium]|nr:MAG: T9SS type A sorting domain-containing protein [bacterium]
MKTNKLVLGLIILVIGMVVIIPNGLLGQSKGGRWQFENNGDDTADWDLTNNSGTLSGTAFYGNESPVIEGNYYLSVEDTNQYSFFYVSDNYELDFSNGNVAISAWIYPKTVDLTTQFIVIKGDHEANPKTNNYALRMQGDHLNFILADNNGQAHKVSSSFIIPTNQWTFVAAFYDHSESLVYLWNEPNEQATDVFSFNAKLFPNNNRLYIGGWGREGYRKFFGYIDDVRIGTRIEEIIDTNTDVQQKNRVLLPSISFKLNQNYPNPFNATTAISFEIFQTESVTLDVYNILGKKTSTLVNQKLEPGNHKFVFDAANFPSEIYFYRLKVGCFTEAKKMILSK